MLFNWARNAGVVNGVLAGGPATGRRRTSQGSSLGGFAGTHGIHGPEPEQQTGGPRAESRDLGHPDGAQVNRLSSTKGTLVHKLYAPPFLHTPSLLLSYIHV